MYHCEIYFKEFEFPTKKRALPSIIIVCWKQKETFSQYAFRTNNLDNKEIILTILPLRKPYGHILTKKLYVEKL